MKDSYCWDCLPDESFDYIISGQAFEHIEYPWLTIKEIYKKLKPGGIVCITAPSAGPEHKYPYDCYRYYSDGFAALAKWAGLTVINISVGGVPEHSVSSEWDSVFNDVCMIATKCQEEHDLENLPKLTYERKYNEAQDWKLRYEFLVKWLNSRKKRKEIQEFLKKNECDNVYIYGYGHIGKLLASELKKIGGIEITIVDKYKQGILDGLPCISLKNGIDSDNATTWREQSTAPKKIYKTKRQDRKTLMIISVLDDNRDLRLYLDTIFDEMPKYYVDEIIH